MLSITASFEDTSIIAHVHDGSGRWKVRVIDTYENKAWDGEMSNEQIGAMLSLAAGAGEDLKAGDFTLVDRHYEVLQGFNAEWRKAGVNPIP